MERGGRFEAGRRGLRDAIALSVNELGVPVVVGIWWSGGFVPFCIGRQECIDAPEEYAVIGGRGCWDIAAREAVKLALGASALLVIGCCRGPCERIHYMPRVYTRRVFYCVAGFSEKAARALREAGFHVVTESLEEALRGLEVKS